MAYAQLSTRSTQGLHPNFRGLAQYASLSTANTSGLRPGLRGPYSQSVNYDPNGQQWPLQLTGGYSESPGVMDSISGWLQSDTFFVGVPNSIFMIGLGIAAWIAAKRKKT
jgi:hypothetical protein